MGPRSIGIASVLVLLAILAPQRASAANQDGTINDNEFVFFFNSNLGGSYSDFASSTANLAGYTFLKGGLAGYGQYVKNNSASVTNLRGSTARVYFNSNYAGPYDTVNAASSRNLVNTYNDNASFRWL